MGTISDVGSIQQFADNVAKAEDPYIVVYDNWDKKQVDINGDGILDVSHGAVTQAIIESAGVKVDEKVPLPDYFTQNVLETHHKELLDKGHKNVYINSSNVVHIEEGSQFSEEVTQGLKKGFTYSFSTGNYREGLSDVPDELIESDNFHIVTATNGNVGEPKISGVASNLPIPKDFNRTENGKLNITEVDGGYDITGNGIADFSHDDISENPYQNFSGKTIEENLFTQEEINIYVDGETNPELKGKTLSLQHLLDDEEIERQNLYQHVNDSFGLDINNIDLSKYVLDAQALSDSVLILYAKNDAGVLEKVDRVNSAWSSYAAPEGTRKDLVSDSEK